MREWNLKSGAYTLAADCRLTQTDYCNDQSWDLSLGGGEPQALGLSTTYGLRARSARIFPRFVESELDRVDPSVFAVPPVIRKLYPNFAEVACFPFTGIEVTAEYWVAASQVVVGRFTLRNTGDTLRQLRLELAFQLTPDEKGERTAPGQVGMTTILCGRTGDLVPVLFMTGGPEAFASPFPSLQITSELKPQESRQITWTQAALPELEASFDAARQAAARNLDAERARIELANAGMVEISTGDRDWDNAFALSQRTAVNLLLSATDRLPEPSFVMTRQPEYGYSPRGDGGDYPPFWGGQTAYDACYLASLLLPSEPGIAEGILRNFLHIQVENGSIDWKPGLGGQRSQLLSAPLLANLAWKIYQVTENDDFLAEVYESLLKFNRRWFDPKHDRDLDGIPEWSHPVQAGLDDHPLFAYWNSWSSGIDITTAESPALCAMLYKECRSLEAIARRLGKEADAAQLDETANNLRSAAEISWDPAAQIYRYWDRDSHFTSPAEILGERTGPGDLILLRTFSPPVRPQVILKTADQSTAKPEIFIHGTSLTGQHLVERLTRERFRWNLGIGSASSERTYAEIERIQVLDTGGTDEVCVQTAGYDRLDLTLLLPLWAGIPLQERVRKLVEETVLRTDVFWRPYGIPVCPACELETQEDTAVAVYLPWNVMIGHGLVDYGYRAEAADLVYRLMKAVTTSLKESGGFRQSYHCETGQGYGETNVLGGLAPLGLFLDALGVRLINPRKVIVSGSNPFPFPVTVKYRGLTVFKQVEKTTVIFPGGQTVIVDDPAPHVVALE